MSMIGATLLNKIVAIRGITQPALILSALHKEVRSALKQHRVKEADAVYNNDGMDLSLIRFDFTSGKPELVFAGAKQSILVIQNDVPVEMKGTRKSIGGIYFEDQEFEEKSIQLEKNSLIYLWSDGYVDQNNHERKKFTRKSLVSNLVGYASFPMETQREKLLQDILNFKGKESWRDDISVVGLKV